MVAGVSPGCLEDDSVGNVDGVIGEPFVKTTKQCHVDDLSS
jgi:hypothetical protein